MEMAPTITTTAIAFRLELSRSTVARKVKQLQEEGVVERINSRKTGYWQVKEGAKKYLN